MNKFLFIILCYFSLTSCQNVHNVENNIPKEQDFKKFFEEINFIYFDRIGQDEIFYNNEYFKF